MTKKKTTAPPAASELPLIGLGDITFLPGQYILRLRNDDGSIRIKPVSGAALRAAFAHEPIDSGWLSPHLRRWGHTERGQFAVLTIPAQKHALRLTSLDRQIHPECSHGRARIEVALPPLLFAGVGTEYALWALAEDAFSPVAPVYHAPLPNVHANGRICWGRNTPPPCSPEAIAEAWKLFITSPFNNHLMGGSSRAFDDDVREQLLHMAFLNVASYRQDDLVPLRAVAHEVVQQLVKLEGRDDD